MAGYPPGSSYPYSGPSATSYASAPPLPYGGAPQPYGGAPQPYGGAPQPYGGAPQPYGGAPQPYGGAPQPYGGAPQPYGGAPQPYGGAPQPYGGDPQPYGGAPQPYGGAPQPYGGAPQPYGGAPQPYGGAPQHYGGAPQPYGGTSTQPYGYSGSTTSAPYAKPEKPGKANVGGGGYEQPTAYGAASPFASLLPSVFPPGTDPSVMACFQMADQDGSGVIDDKELQQALSSYNHSFSIRTVHLLINMFASSNVRKIGPKEFTSLFYSLQSWRAIFERFDRDRSGKIDESELREALLSLGYAVSPSVLNLLLSKFDKSGGKSNGIEYDNFIECCLTVKGLTEKFKEKDRMCTGSATFTYEYFMITVLTFLIA